MPFSTNICFLSLRVSWRLRYCVCVCVFLRRDVGQAVRDSVRVQCGGVSRQSPALHQPELHLDRSSARHRLRQLHVSHSSNSYSSCMWENQNLMALFQAWGNLWNTSDTRQILHEWVGPERVASLCLHKTCEPSRNQTRISFRSPEGPVLAAQKCKADKKTQSKACLKAPQI